MGPGNIEYIMCFASLYVPIGVQLAFNIYVDNNFVYHKFVRRNKEWRTRQGRKGTIIKKKKEKKEEIKTHNFLSHLLMMHINMHSIFVLLFGSAFRWLSSAAKTTFCLVALNEVCTKKR